MKKSKLSTREMVMLLFLVILLIGVAYYMGFYTPLQAEMASIATQSVETDTAIQAATAKAMRMKDMQAELDEILSRPESEITEIAPYDNKEVVLTQLYGILARTQDYKLDFTDPAVQDDGTVRRNISMSFTCADYKAAKAVIRDLSDSQWRCLISSLTIGAEEDMLTQPVEVTATITFFEHTGLE